MYCVRFLETKKARETLPALQPIVAEVECDFKCNAVYRIKAGRAKELTGEDIKDYFAQRGVRVAETPGYEPNANPRAESAVDVVKTRARTMLMALGPTGRTLWPAAVQHTCWTLRHGRKERKLLLPPFGADITTRIKNAPPGGFEPRGRGMKFLGCVDDVTEGILAGDWDNGHWVLEVNSSFAPPLWQRVGRRGP